ncbi:MAG: GtrA family protein [Treponema sp.]|jgi:putative flippase GtrA|nr:GtrA family protein [Treponema sp.]
MEVQSSTAKETVFHALKYALFSSSAALIEFGSENLLEFAWRQLKHVEEAPYWPCYLPALILSVLWNFTINRNLNFKSANNVPVAMLKVLGYYLVFTPVSTLWGAALDTIGWNHNLILILTILANGITEFLFFRFVVFRNSINTRVKN